MKHSSIFFTLLFFTSFNFVFGQTCNLSVSSNVTNSTCASKPIGAIDITVSGATGPVTYSWSGQFGFTSASEDINSLYFGTYYLSVLDSLGCTFSDSFVVTAPPYLNVTFGTTNVLCAGGATGSATVTATGGVPPYNYDWHPYGGTDSVATGLKADYYNITVGDFNGCTITFSVGIFEPFPLTATFSTNVLPQCGQSDGSLSVSCDGGTFPFSYMWNNIDTSSTADSLPAGNHGVTIFDGNGCSYFRVGILNNANGPAFSLDSLISPTCHGDEDGRIYTTISGNSPPFTVEWSNGSLTEDLQNLAGGTYDVHVADASGCIYNDVISLPAPDELTIPFPGVGYASCGAADGMLSIDPYGGTSPYTIQWDQNAGFSTGTYVTNLPAGLYSVTVTDSRGCSSAFEFGLSNFGGPYLNTDQVINPSCQGGTGSIYTSVYGVGNVPFTYLWSNGSTSDDLVNVPEGIYYVIVTDTNNCNAIQSYNLPSINIFPQPICMITVDSATQNNLIIWEKTPSIGIAEFKLYRESSTSGQYLRVATIPFDSLSEFQDTVASTAQHAWKYKLATVDSCGNESDFFASHKSIFLNVSNGSTGPVLNWDSYEGFEYSAFQIWRDYNFTGWTLIDSVPDSVFTYTDVSAPPGFVNYSIEVVPTVGCVSSRSLINTSRSNVKGIVALTTSIAEVLSPTISCFPNPTKDNLTISSIAEGAIELTARVYDVRGREMKFSSYSLIKGKNLLTLNLTEFSDGIYFVELKSGETLIREKIIKQ